MQSKVSPAEAGRGFEGPRKGQRAGAQLRCQNSRKAKPQVLAAGLLPQLKTVPGDQERKPQLEMPPRRRQAEQTLPLGCLPASLVLGKGTGQQHPHAASPALELGFHLGASWRL